MERLKVKELKALSKSLGPRGYSRLNKADLVKLITDHLDSIPRLVPRPRQSKGPPEGIIRRRPPKSTRPPTPPPKLTPPPRPPLREPTRPIPPPRPPLLQRYGPREKGSVIVDVQKPDGMEESREVKYDPKKLKRMKRDLAELKKKIRRSRKRHDNVIRKRNNLRKAIDDMQRAKPVQPERPIPPPRSTQPEFRELEEAFNRGSRTKSHRTKPPWTKSPRQNPPGQNPL